MNLFKKVACFTDIHFGLKSGSRLHNQDCEEFMIWFCETAKAEGAETCIFLGDWHHNRNTTDVSTMNYTVSNLERLNNTFKKVYLIMGNHDEFYKDKREIHSLEFARLFPNIEVVNHTLHKDGVTICPWLVGDEWKHVPKWQNRYVFGHFELPLFMMNALVQMPDHGTLQSDHFVNQEFVFSGHFHKRQSRDKIHYIGNAFPHNFADTWDDQRGMMVLEWGGTPQYIDWPDCPKFRTIKLSQLIDEEKTVIKNKMYLKVNLDIDITFEEANFLKETFMSNHDIREISLIQEKTNLDGVVDDGVDPSFESVDQIVSEQLVNIESDSFDKKLLLEIYNSL